MSNHSVKFWIEPEEIRGEIFCHAQPGEAACRLQQCELGCEEYSVQRAEGGGWFHLAYDDAGEREVRHDLQPDPDTTFDACNMLPWFDGESVEFYYDGEPATVHDGRIEFIWEGDYWTWKYAS